MIVESNNCLRLEGTLSKSAFNKSADVNPIDLCPPVVKSSFEGLPIKISNMP